MAKNKMNLQEFPSDDFGTIRTVMIDGKPMFIGKDIAKALGYKNTKKALKDHVKKKHKLVVNLNRVTKRYPITGNPNVTVIDEPGLYSLIMHSKLPSAEEFQDWVYEKVLPKIREHGYYETDWWKKIRKLGKEERLNLTSAIRMFIDYCEDKFVDVNKLIPDHFENMYSMITCLINDTVDLPMVNDRDELTDKELKLLDICESMVCRIIVNDITDHKKPKKILKHIKNKLNKFKKDAIENDILDEEMFSVDLFSFIDRNGGNIETDD